MHLSRAFTSASSRQAVKHSSQARAHLTQESMQASIVFGELGNTPINKDLLIFQLCLLCLAAAVPCKRLAHFSSIALAPFGHEGVAAGPI